MTTITEAFELPRPDDIRAMGFVTKRAARTRLFRKRPRSWSEWTLPGLAKIARKSWEG